MATQMVHYACCCHCGAGKCGVTHHNPCLICGQDKAGWVTSPT